jgi:hypothetical protein
MSGFLSDHPYLPCPECGASLERSERDTHVCDAERRLDYKFLQLRPELEAFDPELREWLASPQGLFASWEAERDR